MSLNKITKPKWATGAPSYAVEPSESKKTVGWKSQEKPAYQWMNWLFLKAYQWFGWGEERTEFSDSASFHTTGASVTWSGTQIAVPAGGLYLEWRSRNTIVNNILPEATYSLADGEYLVFIPHATPGTVLAAGVYATLIPGQYAIVAGAALVDNVTYIEIIVFKRRGGILEVPLFKTAVQAGGALASNDLLVHKHSDADDGGQLDWDEVWADAIHDHQSDAEGSILDHGNAMTGLGDDDHPQYAHLNKVGQTFAQTISGQTPSLAAHLATKAYVDGLIPDMSHVCYDNTSETISQDWTFNADIIMQAGKTVDGVDVSAFNTAYGAHKHEFIGDSLSPANWGTDFSVSMTDFFDEMIAWKCEYNCSAGGNVYFNDTDDGASGSRFSVGWDIFTNHLGALHLRADGQADKHINITSVVNDGGGHFHFTTDGGDLSAYTTAANARWHTHIMIYKWNNLPDDNTEQYAIAGRFNTAEEDITILRDAYASDDIVFVAVASIEWFSGGFDSDNGVWVRTVNTLSGGRWQHPVNIRVDSGDQWIVKITSTVLPKTTSVPN